MVSINCSTQPSIDANFTQHRVKGDHQDREDPYLRDWHHVAGIFLFLKDEKCWSWEEKKHILPNRYVMTWHDKSYHKVFCWPVLRKSFLGDCNLLFNFVVKNIEIRLGFTSPKRTSTGQMCPPQGRATGMKIFINPVVRKEKKTVGEAWGSLKNKKLLSWKQKIRKQSNEKNHPQPTNIINTPSWSLGPNKKPWTKALPSVPCRSSAGISRATDCCSPDRGVPLVPVRRTMEVVFNLKFLSWANWGVNCHLFLGMTIYIRLGVSRKVFVCMTVAHRMGSRW